MTRLDEMKQNIVEQIKSMDADIFHDFLELLSADYTFKKEDISKMIDISEIYNCNDCSRLYGETEDCGEQRLCKVRFRDYASQEV